MSKYSQDDLELFVSMLEDVVGVPVNQLKPSIEYLQTQQRETAVKPLQDKWGENYEAYLSETEKYFNSLPDERRAMYNNPEGIEYLFETHVKSRLPQEAPAQGQVPQMDRSGLRSTALPNAPRGEGLLAVEDINKMSPDEKAANWDSIKATFAAQSIANQEANE